MPKMKTKSAAKKRFKVTATGKIKRACQARTIFLPRKTERERTICVTAHT